MPPITLGLDFLNQLLTVGNLLTIGELVFNYALDFTA